MAHDDLSETESFECTVLVLLWMTVYLPLAASRRILVINVLENFLTHDFELFYLLRRV